MKTWRRILSSLLALFLVASMLAGCGKKTGGNEGTGENVQASGNGGTGTGTGGGNGDTTQGPPEVFTVATVRYNDMWSTEFFEEGVFKELEEKLNIDIQWEIYTSANWAEKQTAMFIDGDLPDAFFGSNGFSDATYLGNPDYFVELSELIPEYMPNFSHVLEEDPELRYAVTTADGNIYSLGKRLPLRPDADFVLWINQTWLDNLNLEMPKTYEDLANVLKAFADKDANGNGDTSDEIPFSAMMNMHGDSYSITQCFGTAMSGSGTMCGIDENKDLIFMPTQEKYKQAVKWLHELYAYGCCDPECFTQDASMYYSKNQMGDVCRVGMVSGWDVASEVGEVFASEFVPMPPVTGPDGLSYCHSDASFYDISGCEFAITYNCKNPAKLLQWADEFYTDDMSLQTYVGPFGIGCEKKEDGSYYVYDDPDATFAWCNSPRDFGPKWMSPEGQAKVSFEEGNSDGDKLAIDHFYTDSVRDYNRAAPTLKYTEEQYEVISELQGNISSFCAQMHAHWVTDGGIDEEWDDYIDQLNRMNLDDYMAIIQEAYDTYQEVTQ